MIDVTIVQGRRIVCTATVATEAEAQALQAHYPKSGMGLRPQTSWTAVWAEEADAAKATATPEGGSVLRSAYRAWYFKQQIEQCAAAEAAREAQPGKEAQR
jgi:hypothetical protein